jgi:hypothetical protein
MEIELNYKEKAMNSLVYFKTKMMKHEIITYFGFFIYIIFYWFLIFNFYC